MQQPMGCSCWANTHWETRHLIAIIQIPWNWSLVATWQQRWYLTFTDDIWSVHFEALSPVQVDHLGPIACTHLATRLAPVYCKSGVWRKVDEVAINLNFSWSPRVHYLWSTTRKWNAANTECLSCQSKWHSTYTNGGLQSRTSSCWTGGWIPSQPLDDASSRILLTIYDWTWHMHVV